mgnify:CR=1 FL=1
MNLNDKLTELYKTNLINNSQRPKMILTNDGLNQMNTIEFLEHPQDTFVTFKTPAILQCLIKNAERTAIECNNRVKEDV